ncbi:hypothetical protein L3X38_018178 [Prunus dulcis]|uniref:Uncharacterized protein n=1 Tax=Prunus dulcis TaxID=3755 RepID=A0AAD4W987_PRUDU|nr:hypothetical protein L3X38_018178 [Prunus dulcis]
MSGIPKGSSRILGKFGAGPFSWYQSSRFNFLWTLHLMCILKLWGSKWVPSRNGTFATLSPHGREDRVLINPLLGILHCLSMLLIFDCVCLEQRVEDAESTASLGGGQLFDIGSRDPRFARWR